MKRVLLRASSAATTLALVVGMTGISHAQISFPALNNVSCRSGHAGPFPCRNTNLKAFVPLDKLGGGSASDIWGWADPKTKREYALMGGSSGLAIVDVTKPSAPIFLGNLERPSVFIRSIFQDVEVYRNHAFVVCDILPCGLQIFDLTRLRGQSEPQTWTPDLTYPMMPTSHTIDINPRTGFAYLNGIVPGLTGELALLGGQHIIDVSEPMRPIPIGFVPQDGYVHDSHCRIYKGPDERFRGREICLNATPGKGGISIYDVTNKLAPQLLGRATYRTSTYTHQAWLTKDHAQMLVSDEYDEGALRRPASTYIFDIRRLTEPKLIDTYVAKLSAIDHNNYVVGDLVFQAHYTAGLRILDASAVARGQLREIAYFDVFPENDEPRFDGAWAVYPFLPSGNVLISGMREGLFVVSPRL